MFSSHQTKWRPRQQLSWWQFWTSWREVITVFTQLGLKLRVQIWCQMLHQLSFNIFTTIFSSLIPPVSSWRRLWSHYYTRCRRTAALYTKFTLQQFFFLIFFAVIVLYFYHQTATNRVRKITLYNKFNLNELAWQGKYIQTDRSTRVRSLSH